MTEDTTKNISFTDEDFDLNALHPDLVPYLGKSPLGQIMLRHPLVYQVPGPILVTHANQMYEWKRQQLVKLEKDQRYDDMIALYERPWRIPTLMEWAEDDLLSLKMLRETLAWVWQDTELPHQFSKRRLVALFRQAGPITDDGKVLVQEALPLTIYRGVEVPSHRRGMSWTRSQEKAERFALRFKTGGKGYIYQAEIWPQAVLARFKGRGEDEVVADPASLSKIRLFKTVKKEVVS